MTAAEKALALPELLEQILGNLPMHEIMRAKRINSIWRDAVVSSPRLRKHCFLDPTTTDRERVAMLNAADHILKPGTTERLCPGWSDDTDECSWAWHGVVLVHSCLQDPDPEMRYSYPTCKSGLEDSDPEPEFRDDPWHREVNWRDLSRLPNHAGDSRWNMHATQPPTSKVFFQDWTPYLQQEEPTGGLPYRSMISDENGVGLGAVVEALKELWEGRVEYSMELEHLKEAEVRAMEGGVVGTILTESEPLKLDGEV